EYKYTSPAASAPYEILSYGADGKEGGEGPNKDISSLQ
ncbi:MAG TPA: type II secretion system protein GspG, partial [Casimicrobiaceae bacterium]|nr:type II secretion system protein GspG [Casimicrobiaceae bacterium]